MSAIDFPYSPRNEKPAELSRCLPFFYRDLINPDDRIVPCIGTAEEIVKGSRGTLGYYLDGAIRQVLNRAVYTGRVRTFRHKAAVAHALHPALCNSGDPFHRESSGAGCHKGWERGAGKTSTCMGGAGECPRLVTGYPAVPEARTV